MGRLGFSAILLSMPTKQESNHVIFVWNLRKGRIEAA
jgi:hypothetical protein